MDITSPYFVVSVLVVVFAASILWATSSKPDGEDGHDHGHDHGHGHAH